MMDDIKPVETATPSPYEADRYDLATQLVAKLCHDFISPTGAIVSGLDLLEDPSAQDMRAEALSLISTSSKKLVALVHFARVAFGAANSSESFSAGNLRKILEDVFDSMRAELDFDIADETVFDKPAARALLNVGLLTGNSLPMGGKARLSYGQEDGIIYLNAEGAGPRARFKPEVVEGLSGHALGEGLSGQWIQPYWLYSVVQEADGTVSFDSDADTISIKIKMKA